MRGRIDGAYEASPWREAVGARLFSWWLRDEFGPRALRA
jgi:hypothetical protein